MLPTVVSWEEVRDFFCSTTVPEIWLLQQSRTSVLVNFFNSLGAALSGWPTHEVHNHLVSLALSTFLPELQCALWLYPHSFLGIVSPPVLYCSQRWQPTLPTLYCRVHPITHKKRCAVWVKLVCQISTECAILCL